jgi:hypothetical protein
VALLHLPLFNVLSLEAAPCLCRRWISNVRMSMPFFDGRSATEGINSGGQRSGYDRLREASYILSVEGYCKFGSCGKAERIQEWAGPTIRWRILAST